MLECVAQRFAPDPVARPFIAEDVSPAAGASGEVLLIHAVGDRTRARDEHDAGLIADAGDEGDQRVVDDQRLRAKAETAHDAAHQAVVVLTVDAGNADAHRVRPHRLLAERLLDHRVKDLLDFEFAVSMEIRAAAASLAEDSAVAVRQVADRLGAAGIDAEHMHAYSLTWRPRWFGEHAFHG